MSLLPPPRTLNAVPVESPIALCKGTLQALLLTSLRFKYQSIAFAEYIVGTVTSMPNDKGGRCDSRTGLHSDVAFSNATFSSS